MRIDILTLFPDLCDAYLNESIIGRARAKGVAAFHCHNIRDYSDSPQARVDDAPFGGGTGMIMQVQPILAAHEAVCAGAGTRGHVIYMSPQGKPLTQGRVRELAELEHIEILCGHYEGVDERVLELMVDEEISVGDFVVTGGELPALMLVDAITRLLPGTLRNEDAYSLESHYNGLLEHPQYTRPWDWDGHTPPEVLRSGHHANIVRWQRDQSLLRTQDKRPDLLAHAGLSPRERKLLTGAELWDIYDENCVRTGLIQLRDEKIRHGHYHLTVDAWVLRPDGRFLITQRAPEKIAAGQWECTGGSVLYGEDSLEGALRELREETGLVLKPENGHCVISQRRDECRDFKDVWLFRQDFSLADVVLQPGETCDARAVTPEEIRAMLADGTFVNIEYFEELMALM